MSNHDDSSPETATHDTSMQDAIVQSLSSPIRIVGEESVSVSPSDLATLPTRSREIEIVCESGDRYTDRWQGVPVLALLDRASVPDETTHLVLESADGYRACVGIEAALEGLIAFARNGAPLTDVADHDSRFVSAQTKGLRTSKNVRRIETRSLSPGEDPDAYERLQV